MTDEKRVEVTLHNHKFFPYYEDRENVITGQPERVELLLKRGETRSIREVDYQRGLQSGAFTDPSLGDEEETEEFDAMTAELEELVAWIKGDHPTVAEVVEAAQGDAATATKLIEAETQATGNKPRATLVSGLEAVIQSDNGQA